MTTSLGSTTQFPTAGWEGLAPGVILGGRLIGANMNVTTDQQIPIICPARHFIIQSIWVSTASISLTTAAGGVYTAASKGGTAIVAAGQAYSGLTAAAVNAAGSALALTLATGATTGLFDLSSIYFSLTTAQGAAATANIRVFILPLY